MKKNYPREYNSWSAMIARCYNPKHKSINIMEEEELQYVFVGEKNFFNFLDDMGNDQKE